MYWFVCLCAGACVSSFFCSLADLSACLFVHLLACLFGCLFVCAFSYVCLFGGVFVCVFACLLEIGRNPCARVCLIV